MSTSTSAFRRWSMSADYTPFSKLASPVDSQACRTHWVHTSHNQLQLQKRFGQQAFAATMAMAWCWFLDPRLHAVQYQRGHLYLVLLAAGGKLTCSCKSKLKTPTCWFVKPDPSIQLYICNGITIQNILPIPITPSIIKPSIQAQFEYVESVHVYLY